MGSNPTLSASSFRPLVLLGPALAAGLTACATIPQPPVQPNAGAIRFSGDRALEIEADFVTRFPDRESGRLNNRIAAEWLVDTLRGVGFACELDEWEFINYSQRVPLHNAVCRLHGASEQEIVLTAHHDQAPTTTQGADNDGSGVAILIHLAEIFASEPQPARTLVFLFADAEEFGNAGTRRYLDAHPDPGRIAAALSLDNLGKRWYVGLDMDPRGWFRGYGPIWIQRLAQEAARAEGDLWVPAMRPAVLQALEQAVPVAFMDEGPFVARGIPAFGLAGTCAPEFAQLCYDSYHTPADTIDTQSGEVLGQSGGVAEAVARQLLLMEVFPQEAGPYLYFEASRSALRGLPLKALFLLPVAGFFLAAWRSSPPLAMAKVRARGGALPHYLSLLLPLAFAVGSLYAMTAVGLLDRFDAYFATTKDPGWTSPRWPAVGLFLSVLAAGLAAARRLARRYAPADIAPGDSGIRGLAFLAVGLASLFVFVTNPFTLLFTLPLFFWLLIRGRRGPGRALDLAAFALGGLLVYVLIYFFGFVILRIGLYVLWYLMMMFAIPMISPLGAAAICAILAAGLSLVVSPPQARPAAAG